MQEEVPSRTAWRVALRRAAHQLVDTPRVFDDPLAIRIVGEESVAAISRDTSAEQHRVAIALRAFMAARSRFAEDELADAVRQGVGQLVVLGAGLDTFAYRNPFEHLRVFEVDYPATQAWKRTLLERAQIGVPPSLTYVPLDFERQTLAEGLAGAGFNRDEPAFFSWLGVTMYLSLETVTTVFELIGGLPARSGVVFDYSVSPALLGMVERMALEYFSKRVAAIGEPWTLSFDPAELETRLRGAGFSSITDLAPPEINARYFSNRSDSLKVGSLARLASARR